MTSQTAFQLSMDTEGNLYHEPKEIHTYALNQTHHTVISLLAKTKTFITSEHISEALHKELSHNLVKQIIKDINKNATDRLSLAKDLILHRNGEGYKINKKYKIVFES